MLRRYETTENIVAFCTKKTKQGKVLLGKLFKKSKTIKHKQQVRKRVRVRVSSSDSFYDRKFIGRNFFIVRDHIGKIDTIALGGLLKGKNN